MHDKMRIVSMLLNDNSDTKLNRRIFDYLTCSTTFKLSKKNLLEVLENQEI